jgi:hypothetical protein
MVSHSGVSLFLLQCNPTQDDALIQVNIVSYFRSLSDDYTRAMIDEKAAADLCAGMYFDSRQKTVDMGKQSATEPELPQPQAVGNTVHPSGVESRIAGKNLQNTPGCRVFLEYRLDIFLYHFIKCHYYKRSFLQRFAFK